MTDNFSIYAELLPNIRQVSVVASLPSPCDSSTRALLLSDGSRIHVTHHDDSRLLELPAAVVQGGGGSPATLPLKPAADNGCKLTWRFPLDLAYSASAAPQGAIATGGGAGSSVPWEAVNIAGGSTVLCRGCKAVLVPGERIKEWKDLPSANWAEMMEFWHCHKPDDHDAEDGHRHHGHDYDDHRIKGGDKADEQTLAGRGYGANSSIQAQRGVGFVDLMTFLFAEDECRGVEVSYRMMVVFTVIPPLPEFRLAFILGIKKVAGSVQWRSHRYKYPRVDLDNVRSRTSSRPAWAAMLLSGSPETGAATRLLAEGWQLCISPRLARNGLLGIRRSDIAHRSGLAYQSRAFWLINSADFTT